MTAANHYMTDANETTVTLPGDREISIATLVRGMTRLIAVSLLASSLGLWMMPGSSMLPELMLMKLCTSFFLALTGLHLLFAARTPKEPSLK